MREKLQDWLWVAALGLGLLYPSFSKADEADERCGAASQYEKRVGSALPNDAKIPPMAASSEKIALKFQACRDKLSDEGAIRGYAVRGMDYGSLMALATGAPDLQMNPARHSNVMDLITKAYMHKDGVSVWYDELMTACLEGSVAPVVPAIPEPITAPRDPDTPASDVEPKSQLLLPDGVLASDCPTPGPEDSIYVLAYGQYGGPPALLGQRPKVDRMSPAAMCALYEEKYNLRCPGGLMGLYLDGKVLLSSELNLAQPYHASVLLHEYIHHFQTKALGYIDALPDADQCPERVRRERQAHDIQAHVLSKVGAVFHANHVRQLADQGHCP
jgi:hypothetical protein